MTRGVCLFSGLGVSSQQYRKHAASFFDLCFVFFTVFLHRFELHQFHPPKKSYGTMMVTDASTTVLNGDSIHVLWHLHGTPKYLR